MILKIIFSVLLIVHSLIHLLGFLKAFNLANITQIAKTISKPIGVIWLLATIFFLITAVLILLKSNYWLLIGLISVITSQVLIFLFWQDAKFGTIANIIILIGIILNYGSFRFERNFLCDVNQLIVQNNFSNNEIITENDIKHLPEIVKKYLAYTNVINKPKVKNFRAVFCGNMRSRGKDFFEFTSEQYNFFDNPARLFFMKGKMFGLTVPGYHKYIDAKASMNIKLFGLIPIIKVDGEVMDKAETVTLFNDMCLIAPATLIDKNIDWEQINDTTVTAHYKNKGIKISATLIFNNNGRLINFISLDRTDINDMKQYPFSTPIYEYKNFNGFNLPSKADAVWNYPDGEFVYGTFDLLEVHYNIKEIK